MPPAATATLCVHIYCRQVHAVNGHTWPPIPTGQQQVPFYFRTNPALHLDKLHIHTMHSTQPTHTGLTTAATTTTHTIRMDPKWTRRYTDPNALFRLAGCRGEAKGREKSWGESLLRSTTCSSSYVLGDKSTHRLRHRT
ncbi:hypothetical protein Taro_051655 [Colocasia esculenta]|uniref:Uncharacterized protein n=1 Tax=Colocasia esculenta TaxID=4460 RepID=A0A843XHI0_COLES|nr:hypothetical protein [Colocasia esculenta]